MIPAFVWVLVWIPFGQGAPVKVWTFATPALCAAKLSTLPKPVALASCSRVPLERSK
jgi:hypothetical protein